MLDQYRLNILITAAAPLCKTIQEVYAGKEAKWVILLDNEAALLVELAEERNKIGLTYFMGHPPEEELQSAREFLLALSARDGMETKLRGTISPDGALGIVQELQSADYSEHEFKEIIERHVIAGERLSELLGCSSTEPAVQE